MKKVISIFLTVTLLTVTVLAVIACNYTPSHQFEDSVTDNGGMVVEENVVSNGISLLSEPISDEQYEDYGVSAHAENARQLTATITPEDVSDKSVDWTIAWKNAESSWAKGKSVTEYVTLTPTSDGALTASAACLKAFGEQIIIEVKSRVNPAAKAVCTVDYMKKLLDITVTVKNGTQTMLTLGGKPSSTVNWTWLSTSNAESDIGRWGNETVTTNVIWSEGTTQSADAYWPCVWLSASPALKTQLSSNFSNNSAIYGKEYQYYVDSSTTENKFTQGSLFYGSGNASIGKHTGIFEFCSEGYDEGWDILNASRFNKLVSCLKAAAVDFVITVGLQWDGGDVKELHTYNVNVVDNSLKILVTGLSLSNSALMF